MVNGGSREPEGSRNNDYDRLKGSHQGNGVRACTRTTGSGSAVTDLCRASLTAGGAQALPLSLVLLFSRLTISRTVPQSLARPSRFVDQNRGTPPAVSFPTPCVQTFFFLRPRGVASPSAIRLHGSVVFFRCVRFIFQISPSRGCAEKAVRGRGGVCACVPLGGVQIWEDLGANRPHTNTHHHHLHASYGYGAQGGSLLCCEVGIEKARRRVCWEWERY